MAITDAQLLFYSKLVYVILFPILIAILFGRNIRQKKRDDYWNWSRFLLTLAILSNTMEHILEFFYYNLNLKFLPATWMSESLSVMSINTVLSGFIVVFGVAFAAHVNNLDWLTIFPIAFYIGNIIFYAFTGISFHLLFEYIGAVIAIISLYEVAFRVKDNNSLGLALTYTLIFATVFYDAAIFVVIVRSLIWILVTLIAIGKFNPFRIQEDK